mmetsp:Transcript_14520/g.18314  ORF Transcript_14520/g.18314 Transcript_14520/m.18314 type:complete len:102 (+) Transcript_14520:350-655(+)
MKNAKSKTGGSAGFDSQKAKSWFNEQMKNAKTQKGNRSGPDPFFTDFQKSNQSNPNQQYYKDLMGKVFLFAGAIFMFRLLSGATGKSRTVDPRTEENYMMQ